jgi:hypothetical protein
MFGGCEIPEINPGIFEDWRLLWLKAECLREFQPDGKCNQEVGPLSIWLETFLPVLDHFVALAEKNPGLGFRGSVYSLLWAFWNDWFTHNGLDWSFVSIPSRSREHGRGSASGFLEENVSKLHNRIICRKHWISCWEREDWNLIMEQHSGRVSGSIWRGFPRGCRRR